MPVQARVPGQPLSDGLPKSLASTLRSQSAVPPALLARREIGADGLRGRGAARRLADGEALDRAVAREIAEAGAGIDGRRTCPASREPAARLALLHDARALFAIQAHVRVRRGVGHVAVDRARVGDGVRTLRSPRRSRRAHPSREIARTR